MKTTIPGDSLQTPDHSRRRFLTTAGLTAASLWLVPRIFAKDVNASAPAVSVGALAANEQAFREGVMPRAQLSMIASQLAVEKATQANAKEFAGFELMEAIAVIDVLKDKGTAVPLMDGGGLAFLEKLRGASGREFDQLYMQAELSNHEYLRDLAENYLLNASGKTSAAEYDTIHLASLALFAFKEHVWLSGKIYRELSV